jgi:hypothetical protein
VPRKSKIETAKADAKGADPTPNSADGSAGTARKTAATATKPKQKKAAPKKIVRATKTTGPQKASTSAIREPSDEQIRIRAYFIAERRLQLSLQGDSAHDWIEARRQLIDEAGPAAPSPGLAP